MDFGTISIAADPITDSKKMARAQAFTASTSSPP